MENLNCSEVKLFSERSSDKAWESALNQGSRSSKDAVLRKGVYQKVFSRYTEMKEQMKAFSGYTEIPLLSNQYFNATMASYVRSFAGFLTIERDMDQPTALLWFMDLLGVTDNRKVLPNIGSENLAGVNARFQTSSTLTVAQATYTISTGKKLIPGSVEVQLIHAANPQNLITIKDDRNGNLMASAGVLAANPDAAINVNYTTGLIKFTTGAGFTIATGDSYSILAYEDIAGSPEFGTLAGTGNNRFKMDMNNIIVTSEPDMLVAENNLMAMATMQKAIGANPQDVAGAKITELYTKLVNGKLVKAVQDSFVGNAYDIDAASWVGA